MEIEYRRYASKSYMIIKAVNCPVKDYEMEMLRHNKVVHYLPFHCIVEDGKLQIWYDISGKKSLETMGQIDKLSGELFERLMYQIDEGQQELQKYLLDENHTLLTQESIYVDQEGEVFFTYLSDCNCSLREQLENLFEGFMKSMDYEQADGVDLVYRFYEAVREDTFLLHETCDAVERWKKEWSEEHVRQDEMKQEIKTKVLEEKKKEEEERYRIQSEQEEQAHLLEMQRNKEESYLEGKIRQFTPIATTEKEKVSGVLSTYMKGKKQELGKNLKKWTTFKLEKREEPGPIMIDPEEEETCEYPTVYLGEEKTPVEGELIYEGDGEQENLRVIKDKLVIGKSIDAAEGILHEASISRFHALIRKEGEEYYLEDMNSANGTYINGNRLAYRESVKLQKNDRVRFAKLNYRFY